MQSLGDVVPGAVVEKDSLVLTKRPSGVSQRLARDHFLRDEGRLRPSYFQMRMAPSAPALKRCVYVDTFRFSFRTLAIRR